MKKFNCLMIVLLLSVVFANAQSETGIMPPSTAKEGEYTEWKKVTLEFPGSEQATYEYRIAFIKRKALACSFDLQVKNTSAIKIQFKVDSHYYDRFVKDNFGDKFSEKIKAGQTMSFNILTQGNKANKENKDEDDFTRCMGCNLFYNIHVEKD